ncbi:MAG: methyltransferase domain-containing protein [Planctomycetota bacterium]
MIRLIEWFHEHQVHRRRVRVLADCIADLLPENANVLDVGCGDGELAAEILLRRPDVIVQGIDVLVREDTAIPVHAFDGQQIPFDNGRFEIVILVDVLHHTETPDQLLRESHRVANAGIVIKDHNRQGFAAQSTLSFMDRVGNARHGVALPCNYLAPREWQALFEATGLRVHRTIEKLRLYPWPLSWVFERHLHFVAFLKLETPLK